MQPIERINGKFVVFTEATWSQTRGAAGSALRDQDGLIALLISRRRATGSTVRRETYAADPGPPRRLRRPAGEGRRRTPRRSELRRSHDRTVRVAGRGEGFGPSSERGSPRLCSPRRALKYGMTIELGPGGATAAEVVAVAAHGARAELTEAATDAMAETASVGRTDYVSAIASVAASVSSARAPWAGDRDHVGGGRAARPELDRHTCRSRLPAVEHNHGEPGSELGPEAVALADDA